MWVRTCRSSPVTWCATPSPIPTCSWRPPQRWACPSRAAGWSAAAGGTCWRGAGVRPGGGAVVRGGEGGGELEKAGAFRVYEDPLALLAHLDEVGVREHAEAPRREPQF